MPKKDNILVGLDIGTTKICTVVGEVSDDGKINIIGMGTNPSRGLKKGVVVNIESTVDSIKKAVEEAELMAGVEINSVYAGIAGGHIKSFNSRGVIAVKDEEVSQGDIGRVVDAARAVAIPLDRKIIHVISQEFIIDGQDGIKEPLGMSGVRLEAEVHIITGAVTSVQNIIKSVNRAGLEVLDIILQPLASSEAVLTPEEKELGVILVDIGGGTTDIATFMEGSLCQTAVIGIGGNHLTNDIAIGFRTPAAEAEKIKIKYGCALSSLVKEDETIEVPSVGGRSPRVFSRQALSDIVQPRAEEIYSLVEKEIRKIGLEEMVTSGVVITGGTSIMEGMPEISEQVLNLPVRRGIPMNVGGLVDIVNSPIYATGVGLLLYAMKNQYSGSVHKFRNDNLFNKVFYRMKEWIGEYF